MVPSNCLKVRSLQVEEDMVLLSKHILVVELAWLWEEEQVQSWRLVRAVLSSSKDAEVLHM